MSTSANPSTPTHYDVLGLNITKNPNAKEITKAYRKKALLMHPDKCNIKNQTINAYKNATKRFETLGSAYEILSDPEKKYIYNQSLQTAAPHSSTRIPRPGASARASHRYPSASHRYPSASESRDPGASPSASASESRDPGESPSASASSHRYPGRPSSSYRYPGGPSPSYEYTGGPSSSHRYPGESSSYGYSGGPSPYGYPGRPSASASESRYPGAPPSTGMHYFTRKGFTYLSDHPLSANELKEREVQRQKTQNNLNRLIREQEKENAKQKEDKYQQTFRGRAATLGRQAATLGRQAKDTVTSFFRGNAYSNINSLRVGGFRKTYKKNTKSKFKKTKSTKH